MFPPFNNISSHVSASLLLTLSRCSSSSLLTPILLLLLLLSAGSPSLKLENTTPKTENKNSHARNATIFHTSAALIFFFCSPFRKILHYSLFTIFLLLLFRLLTDDRRWLHLFFLRCAFFIRRLCTNFPPHFSAG